MNEVEVWGKSITRYLSAGMRVLVLLGALLGFFDVGCTSQDNKPHRSRLMELYGVGFHLRFEDKSFTTNYNFHIDAHGDTTAEYSITDTTNRLKPQLVIKATGGAYRCDNLTIYESAQFYEKFMNENYNKYIHGDIMIRKSDIDNIEVTIVRCEVNEIALFCNNGRMYIIDAFRFDKNIDELISVQLPRQLPLTGTSPSFPSFSQVFGMCGR